MREPEVVYMLEITEFEKPSQDSDQVNVRQWPTIYGRTEEAVYEWFDDASEQRECLFWFHWSYFGVLKVGRRRGGLLHTNMVLSPTRRSRI